VRITFKTSGGIAAIPGLSRPRTIDAEALPAEARHELERLLAAAHFFDLPTDAAARPGTPDARSYTITVEAAGRSHTVRRSEPIEEPGLAAAVSWLRRLRPA
jgi:emfourin